MNILPFHPLAQILDKNPKHETLVWSMVLVYQISSALGIVVWSCISVILYLLTPDSSSHHSFCFLRRNACSGVLPIVLDRMFWRSFWGRGLHPLTLLSLLDWTGSWPCLFVLCDLLVRALFKPYPNPFQVGSSQIFFFCLAFAFTFCRLFCGVVQNLLTLMSFPFGILFLSGVTSRKNISNFLLENI